MKYTSKEIKHWAKNYIRNDFTLDTLESFLDIPHSTLWWSFQHKLKDIDYDLYRITMKKLKINKSLGGRRPVTGKVVITSKQNIELPKSFVYDSKDVKKDLIIWRFKTENQAIKAAKVFMNKGFEVVRRIV